MEMTMNKQRHAKPDEVDCICTKCKTLYSDEDLECLEDEGGFFKGCGVCKTDAHLMDIWTSEEEGQQ